MKAIPKTLFSAVIICQIYLNVVTVFISNSPAYRAGINARCPFSSCVIENRRESSNEIIVIYLFHFIFYLKGEDYCFTIIFPL